MRTLLAIFWFLLIGMFVQLNMKAQSVPLYSLWWDGTTEYLIQIDPYNATHTIVGELEGVNAVALGSSTMVHGAELYVFKGSTDTGFDIVFVDAKSGNIVNQVPASSYPDDFFTELEYDLQSYQMWGLQSNFATDTIVTIDTLFDVTTTTFIDTIITIDTFWIDSTTVEVIIDTLLEPIEEDSFFNIVSIDTTYELFNAQNSLVGVDLNDGSVGDTYPIAGTEAILVNSSTFNSNEGHYIYLGQDQDFNTRLYTINTVTGDIVHNPISDLGNAELHYDNILNNLYGLGRTNPGASYDPFDPFGGPTDSLALYEIDQVTGEKTIVAIYPEADALVLGGSAYIADSSQFVFSGVSFNGPKRMYVTDVVTGEIISDTPFTENYVELQVNNYEFSQKLYAPTYLEVDLKVFLEGSYNNAANDDEVLMSDLNYLLDLEQPYNTAPYNYTGTESITSTPFNMVDWVLVEIRTGVPNLSGEKGTTTVASQAAILQSDGSIVGMDGAPLRFQNLPESPNFYICVRHRNHLDVLSATPVANSGTVSYDFTTGVEMAFGNAQMKLSNDGSAVLYAGDYNSDGVIQTTDFDLWFANPAALNVYESYDGNMDGVIQVTDYDIWFNNKAKVGTVEIGF